MRSLLALAAVLVLGATLGATAHADDCARKVGEQLPNIKNAVDENGKSVNLRTGGWVFVTVGASWCKPCAKELPTWDQLPGNHPKVKFYAVDISEKASDGKAFHQKLGLKNLNKAYTAESNIANLGSVMPSSYLVDPKGIIRSERCGFDEHDASGELKRMNDEISKLAP
jgi:thiol-disulfide isomerase/thioredoxin|nr:TlpA disulfide reductase family protein [Kofleriaceae bacterium]